MGVLDHYRERLAAGELTPDPAQEAVAKRLQAFSAELAEADRASWWQRLLQPTRDRTPTLQGVYIFGSVGRGKSMLMDLFFANAPIAAKRRVHFHAFMQEIHAELHAWRRSELPDEAEPIQRLAKNLVRSTPLLCLDELEIIDIADAMIVGKLFETMTDEGIRMVITSNRPPSELYKDGLQRDRFLPFIEIIEDRFEVVHLDAPQDYRRLAKTGIGTYHTPLGVRSGRALDEAFSALTSGAKVASDSFVVHGREVDVPLAGAGVARFSFSQLCTRALGPADYLALARRYHTLVLSDIPLLANSPKDEVRRFIILIDALYDHGRNLICSAAARPDHLYPDGDHAIAFHRTASRLLEMQSEEYLMRHAN